MHPIGSAVMVADDPEVHSQQLSTRKPQLQNTHDGQAAACDEGNSPSPPTTDGLQVFRHILPRVHGLRYGFRSQRAQ